MPEKTFVDTSAFFAFLNKSDVNHQAAKKRLSGSGVKVTSNFIFDELITLMMARDQKDLSVSFGEKLRSGALVQYHFLKESEEEKAWTVYQKYSDHVLSFTDCTTLALLGEYKNVRLLSFDEGLMRLARHFEGT